MALADEPLEITMDRTTELRSLIAGPIAMRVSLLDVGERVEMHGKVDVDTANRIFTTGTFHVDEADDPPGWDSGRAIDIVLRLRGPIAATYDDVDDFAIELFKDEDSPLRHTEAWLLLEAMQETEVPGMPDATASFGVRTDWADPIVG